MSVAAADLKLYNAANRPTTDSAAGGGAVDPTMRPIFTQFGAAAKVTFQSDNAGDTQDIVIVGRDAAGRVTGETLALDGLTETASVNTYSRILSHQLATVALGTITVRQGAGGTTIQTILPGEKGGAALFQDSVSAAAPVVRYDKVFWKNTNATWALLAALHQLAIDATGTLEVGIAAAKGDSVAITNRLTAPAGIAFVGLGEDQAVPTSELDAGEVIGIWIKQTLAAYEAPHDVALSLTLSGATA